MIYINGKLATEKEVQGLISQGVTLYAKANKNGLYFRIGA